jgi:tripartite-type tricarboxylate transporter receptor subunit TctC
MRLLRRLGLAALALLALATQAAETGGGPLRIVVPFPPGGGTDVVARALAEKLGPALATQVIVDNRPGGNSVIATRYVAASPADGNTLLLTTDIHAINAAYGLTLPYDSIKDFAFVGQLTTSPLLLVAHPSLAARTLPELVTLARAQPGKLSFASLGSSSPHYLGFEWFKRLARIDVIDVPYKGGGQALVDLIGGQVSLSLIVAGNGVRQAKAGKVTALAVTSPVRTPVAPDVPTIAESGYPEFALVNWYAILAPAGTPSAVVRRLNREIGIALRDPAIVERIAASGLEVSTGSPAELEELLRRDIERYRRIIALTGAKPDEQR